MGDQPAIPRCLKGKKEAKTVGKPRAPSSQKSEETDRKSHGNEKKQDSDVRANPIEYGLFPIRRFPAFPSKPVQATEV